MTTPDLFILLKRDMPDFYSLMPFPQQWDDPRKILGLTKCHMCLYVRPSDKSCKQFSIDTLTQILMLMRLNTPSAKNAFNSRLRHFSSLSAEFGELGTVLVLVVVGRKVGVYALSDGHSKWIVGCRVFSGELDVEHLWAAGYKLLHNV